MPITQDRMISLIDATRGVINTVIEHKKLIEGIVRSDMLPGGRIARANEIMSNASASADDMRRAARIIQDVIQGWMEQAVSIQFPLEALLTLTREETHFWNNKRRNEMNASAVRTHRLRKKIAEELIAEGKTPITGPHNMPSLNTGISESPLNKTPEEIDRDATEARLRFEAYARGEDPDKVVPVQSTYTREDYERDRDVRLREAPAPISVVRNEDKNQPS